jgi:hypothetical protein
LSICFVGKFTLSFMFVILKLVSIF